MFAEVEGPAAAVSEFLLRLERERAPAGQDRAGQHAGRAAQRFDLVRHRRQRPGRAAPDAGVRRHATCADCLRELADPADRRFGYPFINCTNCGPRFTIVRDVPYDRPLTTMAAFAMCEPCAAEYHDPADRRFHAQPTCCPACGPRLALRDPAGTELPGDPIAAHRRAARRGPGPGREGPGRLPPGRRRRLRPPPPALRARKHREDKPFAVLAADLAAARELAHVDAAAAGLLASRARPIVLLPRRPARRSPPRSPPATASSASCCPTPRCTTC